MRTLISVAAVVIVLGTSLPAEACSLCNDDGVGGAVGLVELSLVLPTGLTLASLVVDGFSVADVVRGRRPSVGRLVTGVALAVASSAVDAMLLWAYGPILKRAPSVTATLVSSLVANVGSLVLNVVLATRPVSKVSVVPWVSSSSGGVALTMELP